MAKTKVSLCKEFERERNEGYRQELHRLLFTPVRLPDAVVAGTHETIVGYKEFCDEIAGVYHVRNAPGKSNTLKELQAINARLSAAIHKLENFA